MSPMPAAERMQIVVQQANRWQLEGFAAGQVHAAAVELREALRAGAQFPDLALSCRLHHLLTT